MKYLSGSLLTSYADLVVVDTLMRLSGNSRDRLAVRSAREFRPRDLEQGAFVFVGSPSSNPWVSYFQDKLNFRKAKARLGKASSSSRMRIRNQESKQPTKVWPSPGVRERITPRSPCCHLPTAAAVFSSCKDCSRREPRLPDYSWPMPATGKNSRRPSASPARLPSLSTSKPSSALRQSPALQMLLRSSPRA